MARHVAGIQHALVERIGVREDGIRLVCVAHVFLDAEVGHPQVEMQRRAHADGRQVGGAVAAGAHLIQRRQVRDAAQSQMELKISPTASGVVVCWRIRRNASWFSAGVASSIQNRL
ncbi:hypothetical protein G6F65_021686 [Rhizopus arrhizus]|nr:hypothetical protein G6F65_021686 [Rhizopus arrhizus]